MDGEVDEILVYFPDAAPKIALIRGKIAEFMREVDNYWFAFHDEPSKKKFALYVKDIKGAPLLFMARKLGGLPRDYLTTEFILKFILDDQQ